MPELEQAGTFRGRITQYGLSQKTSGAHSVYIEVAIDEVFEDGEWGDWRAYELTVTGDLWVVKKDGTLNDRQITALCDYAGWDGSFAAVAEGRWKPTPVQVRVQENVYKDETRYRINWINAYDAVPGGGNVSADEAKKLEAKFGSQVRAICGNAVRAATKPDPAEGGPTKPAGGVSTPKITPPTVTSEAEKAADDIPF